MNKETVKITKEFTYDNVGNLTKEVLYEEREQHGDKTGGEK